MNLRFHLNVLFVVILLSTSLSAQKGGLEISVKDISDSDLFTEETVSGLRSMADGRHYTTLEDNRQINRYSYRTGVLSEVVLGPDKLIGAGIPYIYEYEFSADESYILISTNIIEKYRYSYLGEYYLYSVSSGLLTAIIDSGRIEQAGFSPDGNYVSYVKENNLFYTDLRSGEHFRVTRDGLANHIINGVPDWVYEEEFAFNRAYAWSPDSKKIAFYRFDESAVREYSLTGYGELYPSHYNYKFPKAGEKNSLVSIMVCDLDTKENRVMDTGKETDQYIPRIKWTNDPDKLSILRLNRLQNRLDLIIADAFTGNSDIILTEKNKYFITEVTDNRLVFLDDGYHFIYMSEQDGYKHYYLYNLQGELQNQVTKGDWDIIDFLGVDQQAGTMYYTSYEESSVTSNVYRIGLDGQNKEKISPDPGWNRAEFSNSFDYYIHFHSSTNTPGYISLHNRKGKLIRILEDNTKLKAVAESYELGTKELFIIKTEESIELNAYILKPRDFDKNKTYPLMMFVYGGPDSQKVRNEWETRSWHHLLVQKGYLVVCVDNRGTDGKGEEFRKSTYMQLGKYELVDQMQAVEYLGSLPYIDQNRIGIWGWSYGGYMTTLCLTKGGGLFKMGIAVAPVTNWRYYDTVYTERFLRTPQENPAGYDENSPIFFADSLQGELLLIHGMGDDNVHFQNSVDFTEALVQAGKQFNVMFYPNRDHNIIGGNTRSHLYSRMTAFVLENL